jgi:hypothetical protein
MSLPAELIFHIFCYVDIRTLSRCYLHSTLLRPYARPNIVQRVGVFDILIGDDDTAVQYFKWQSYDPARGLFTYLPHLTRWGTGYEQRGGFVVSTGGLELIFRGGLHGVGDFTLFSHRKCHLGLQCSPEWHVSHLRVPPLGKGAATFEHRHNGFDAVHCDIFFFDIAFFCEAVTAPTGILELLPD